ncbi:uncharacterized protein DS421_9g255510 [Arachis hypogaea]|nr:uncharacterized protein DS421_9g255510 [Arachis hypogaea]
MLQNDLVVVLHFYLWLSKIVVEDPMTLKLTPTISIRNQVARAANTACVESWSDLKGCTSVGYLPCKQECIRKYGSASYGYCANISHCICVFVCVLIN